MEKSKPSLFIFSVIAIILGVTLIKKFDAHAMKFENNALAVVYIITFIGSVIMIIKALKKN